MAYDDAFRANASLIKSVGEGNAHLVWAMAMYLEEPDFEALASEALTDGPNDKKIDFIYLDRDAKRIVFAQGYARRIQSRGALRPSESCCSAQTVSRDNVGCGAVPVHRVGRRYRIGARAGLLDLKS